jgi:hypothetical protein
MFWKGFKKLSFFPSKKKKLSFKRKILKKTEFNPTVLLLGIYLLSLSAHSVYFLFSGLEQGLGGRDVGQGFPLGIYHEWFFFKSKKSSDTWAFSIMNLLL